MGPVTGMTQQQRFDATTRGIFVLSQDLKEQKKVIKKIAQENNLNLIRPADKDELNANKNRTQQSKLNLTEIKNFCVLRIGRLVASIFRFIANLFSSVVS